MKKLYVFLLVIIVFLFATSSTTGVFANTSTAVKIYLGEDVAKLDDTDGVWQTGATISQLGSSVKYAYEQPANNTFVKMANFDGDGSVNSTAMVIRVTMVEVGVEPTLTLKYRLYEGENNYSDTDKVLAISYRGETKVYTFADLSFNAVVDFSWKSLTVNLTNSQTISQVITIEYFHKAGVTYADGKGSLDIDDVSLNDGSVEYCSVGNFEFANVATETPDVNISIGGDLLTQKAQYLLSCEDGEYEINTDYTQTYHTNFNNGVSAKMLARSGSEKIYRGASSVGRGEGDNFVIFDSYENNSFLRLGNYNGTTSTSTAFVNYWHNNETDQVENMPKTNTIYYSFKYRLYMDDVVRAGLAGNHKLLEFSTRSSNLNNFGKLCLEEFIINQPNDPTWHYKKGEIITGASTGASIGIYFHGATSPTFDLKTFIDLDDFYMGVEENGVNYTYLNGTFEGMAGENIGLESVIETALKYNPTLGSSAVEYARNSLDGEMELRAGATFSLGINQTINTNVFNVKFETDAKQDQTVKIYFGGRSGENLTLTVGKNLDDSLGKYTVKWDKTDIGYNCSLYYIREDGTELTSLDFVNNSSDTYRIDEVFIGQVEKINTIKGDYESYQESLEQVVAQSGNLIDSAKRNFNSLKVKFADGICELSSQEKMDNAISVLTNALQTSQKISDLTELKLVIVQAESVLEQGGKAYTNGSYLRFKNALLKAKQVTQNDTQITVDNAENALREAINSLTPVQTYSINVLRDATIAGTTTLGGGALVVGSIMFIKKRKENKDEKN